MAEDYADYQLGKKKKSDYTALVIISLAIFLLFVTVIYSYLNSGNYLLWKLGSDDPDTREWAAAKLISKGSKIVSETLQTASDESVDMAARRMAVYVLGELRDDEIQKEVEKLFTNGPIEIKEEAAIALVKSGDPKVIRILTGPYRRASKSLKMIILHALGELGLPGALDVLAVASSSEDEDIKNAADEALAKIRNRKR